MCFAVFQLFASKKSRPRLLAALCAYSLFIDVAEFVGLFAEVGAEFLGGCGVQCLFLDRYWLAHADVHC